MRVWHRFSTTIGPQVAHNLLVDAGAAGLFAIFQALTGPFIGIVAVQRGATAWQIGMLSAAPFAAMLLSGWYARWAEGSRRVSVVVWSTALARICILLVAWSHGLNLYILGFSAYSLLTAASNPAYTAVERAIYHRQWRGQLMSAVKVVLGLSQFAATLVAGGLLDHYGPGPVFTLAIGFGLASSLVFSRIREPAAPAPRPLPRGRRGRSAARSDPRLTRLLWAVTLAGGGNLLIQPGLPIYQVTRLHLDAVFVAWITAAWSLAFMAAYPLWGRVCDHRRPATAIAVAFACYLVPPLCYLVHGGLPLLLFAGAVQGFGDAALDVGWQNHVMRLTDEGVGGYAGLYFTYMGMRGTVAPLLGGAIIASSGLSPLFALSMVLVACGLWVARRLPDAPLTSGEGAGQHRGADVAIGV